MILPCHAKHGQLLIIGFVQIHVFIILGESLIADTVIRESESEESAAKTFLEDVRLTFPEVNNFL